MRLDFTNFQIPQLILMAIIGVAVLLFGYRIKKIGFFIIWFLLGLNLTIYLMPWINSVAPAINGNALWQNLLPIAGGLLFGLLGFSIEKFCVGAICFALVMLITVQYFGSSIQTLAIGAVIGIIVAAVAVMMIKPAIIIATAIAGAYALTSCILTWAAGSAIDAGTFYFPILIGLSALGAIFQFCTTDGID